MLSRIKAIAKTLMTLSPLEHLRVPGVKEDPISPADFSEFERMVQESLAGPQSQNKITAPAPVTLGTFQSVKPNRDEALLQKLIQHRGKLSPLSKIIRPAKDPHESDLG